MFDRCFIDDKSDTHEVPKEKDNHIWRAMIDIGEDAHEIIRQSHDIPNLYVKWLTNKLDFIKIWSPGWVLHLSRYGTVL